MPFPSARTFRSLAVLVLTLSLGASLPAAPAQAPAAAKPEPKQPEPRTAEGKRLLSALDVLRLTGVDSPRLSPDGAGIAYTASETRMDGDNEWKSVTHVWVVATAGGPARQFTRGDRGASSPAWSPDGRHVAFLTNRDKEEERQVWMLPADGGEAWQVTTHKGGVSDFHFSPDGKKLLLAAVDQPNEEAAARKKRKDDVLLIDRDIRMTHLWIWDIASKEGRRLTEGAFHCSDPQWSPDGTQITFTTYPTPKPDDGGLSDLWVLSIADGKRRKLVENEGTDRAARWSPDGKWIAYNGSPQSLSGLYQTDLYVIPAAGGATRALTTAFELDAGTPLWSPDGKTIYFTSNTRQAMEVFAADVATGGVTQRTERNGILSLTDVSADGKVFVGISTSSHQPSEVTRADSALQAFVPLTRHNDWLRDYALGDVEVIRWTSKDGTEIEGVLTKPVGFTPGRKYPFLLNPHGGPTGASMTNFNSLAQLFAANGYVTLQPNFRGSTGRGEKFAQANKDSWGKGDYEDCMSGVQAAIDRGWADPQRLGAHGWSYGGYMTFWILTQTDIFKAVSPGAGLTNIYSMYSQNDIQRYLRWFYGDKSPWDNVELYYDRSPMKWVRHVKTPTMIMHGQNDQRVPIAQAQEFYRALLERGVPVDFVVYPRAGHGISEPRHQLDRMRRYLEFFGKYLNNPAVTEPSSEDRGTSGPR